MREVSIHCIETTAVNRTRSASESSSPGTCSSAQQRGPGRQPATARMKWDKAVKKVVMECFYNIRSFDEVGTPIRGYRQRMFREWRERGVFESTEQRVYDQARVIRKNGWLSEVELDAIKVQVESEPESQIYREQNNIVEIEPVENVIENVEEEFVDVEHSLHDTEDNICEEAGEY